MHQNKIITTENPDSCGENKVPSKCCVEEVGLSCRRSCARCAACIHTGNFIVMLL